MPVIPTVRCRSMRAVEAVERIGTPEAVELVREWAKQKDTVLGAEATAAVGRK